MREINGYLCRDYLEYSFLLGFLDLIVPVVIITLNVLLLKVATKAVKWIKYETKSKEVSVIQSAVFFLTFFNTALSILLINANFTGENNTQE